MIIDDSVPLLIIVCFLNDNNSFNKKINGNGFLFHLLYFYLALNIEPLETKTS